MNSNRTEAELEAMGVNREDLVDGGPSPALTERAWRPMRERFGEDFEAAHEDACRMSDELARLYRAEPVLRKPFDRRLARMDEVIARAEARVARLKGERVTLEANREAALKPNRTSREWRLDRLDEFRRDYNGWLRLKANARSLALTGGKFTFTHHKGREKLIEPMGADGNPIAGRTDEAALVEVLAVLKRCGLHDLYEPLVVTEAKVALNAVKPLLKLRDKKGNLLREDGLPILEVYVKGKGDDDFQDRIAAEGGTCWPTIDKTTGDILGWTVKFPAVQVIRNPETGAEVMRRPLVREAPPAEEWTIGFVPSEPGQVPEEDEGETDGEE